jgi:threonine/homoserine/homoserine lactone efflux protein
MVMPLEPATLVAFALTAAVIVISPGPDTVVILRHALATGRTAGLTAVVGVQFGLLIHTALAALGISALIAASPMLFKALALAGAFYLAWLGIRLIVAGRAPSVLYASAPATTTWRAGREALLTNLLNPKVLVLFLALYPNFIAASHGAIAPQIACLSVVLIAVNIIWQVGLVWSADRARLWLGQPAVERSTQLCVGTALSAFAVLLVVEHVF